MFYFKEEMNMTQVSVVLKNETGLHARPASQFTKEAAKYKSKVTIKKGNKEIDAKRILSVLSLGVNKDDILIITGEGEDEEQAVAALKQLIDNNFGQ
jgi:phosphotransferase system HPr (HPr) family protein